MNIGKASAQTGLPVRTIHYYEEIELVVPARRGNGYRDYGDTDLHKLSFLHRARGLGFSVEDCRALLTLYVDRKRASADVKKIATWDRETSWKKPQNPPNIILGRFGKKRFLVILGC